MPFSRRMVSCMAAGALASLVSLSAAASTITFDSASPGDTSHMEAGFRLDPVRIVNGNCDATSGAPCLAVNINEQTVLTRVGGGLFTLDSFWFDLLGNGGELSVAADNGPAQTFDSDTPGFGRDGVVVNVAALFMNVSSITFSSTSSNPGNIRIDDLGVSPVPLPAAAWLFLSGLIALFGFKKRAATRA